MDFTQEYKQKLVTADEAVKTVRSGDWVDYGWCTNTAESLDKALEEVFFLNFLLFLNVRTPVNTSPGIPGICPV